MQEVILTVGPRASGKSCFCDTALALDSSLTLISRDQILTTLFGKTLLDPYSGGHEYVLERMWEIVKEQLNSPADVRMILDIWNGSSQERVDINQQLRRHGADRIVAWYFITPVECVDEWFWQKSGIAKIEKMGNQQKERLVFYGEDSPRRDHKLFHELAMGINNDGFDSVIKINPLVMKPEHVLKL